MCTLKNNNQNQFFTLYLKKLEKEEHTKPKASKRKAIIKIRVEINKIKNIKTYRKLVNQKFAL